MVRELNRTIEEGAVALKELKIKKQVEEEFPLPAVIHKTIYLEVTYPTPPGLRQDEQSEL